MKKEEDLSLVYITELDSNNYKEHVSTMRENLKRVFRATSMSKNRASRLIGINRNTIKRFLDGNDNISFITANKLNNFVYNINEAAKDKLK